MVTFTGHYTNDFVMAGPYPHGMFSVIAVDGTHHLLFSDGTSSNTIEIVDAETKTVHTILTPTQFRTDLTAQLGIGTTDVTISAQRFGVPGTPYFIVLSNYLESSIYYVVGLRYKLLANGSYTIDGKYHYRQNTTLAGRIGGAMGPVGVTQFNNTVYYIADFGEHASGFAEYLAYLTLVGNDVDLTLGSWNAQLFSLPDPMDNVDFWTYSLRDYKNRACLYQHASGVGVLALATIGDGALQDGCFHTVVNTSTGTNTGYADVSTVFGLPFSDSGKGLSGSSTGNSRDYYTSPVIINNELIFPRSFSDNHRYLRIQRYSWDGIDSVSFVDTVTYQFTELNFPADIESVYLARESSNLHIMFRSVKSFIFGTLVLAPPTDNEACIPAMTFSLFKDTTFHDWTTEATDPHCGDIKSPANFESVLWTYYMMVDDNILWMQSPYVYTFMNNTSRNFSDPSLLMTAIWDWSEDTVTNKHAREAQVYDYRQDQTVSNTKNRIRGSGRALKLKFASEESKDWNLLGWNIWFERNARF